MWWTVVALAAAPEVGVKDVMTSLGTELGRAVVVAHARADTARCRLEIHGVVPALGRYEAAVQAAGTAGVEARMTATEIRLDRASVPARPELETHVFPFDGDAARLDRVWAAAGADAVVTTATGALIVTLFPANSAGAVAAAAP